METQQQQLESINSRSPEDMLAIKGAENKNLPKLPPAAEPEAEWQQIARKISDFLEYLPDYWNRFFQSYQQVFIFLGLFLATLITAKIVLGILDAINDIPLLSPAFELIGIIYTTWFVSRYLIQATTRQELAEEVRLLKQQIISE